jgi:5-formyltetrahydrofolate cyclo-ligase
VTIGVCFAPQIVVDLPTDEHDVLLQAVVTD